MVRGPGEQREQRRRRPVCDDHSTTTRHSVRRQTRDERRAPHKHTSNATRPDAHTKRARVDDARETGTSAMRGRALRMRPEGESENARAVHSTTSCAHRETRTCDGCAAVRVRSVSDPLWLFGFGLEAMPESKTARAEGDGICVTLMVFLSKDERLRRTRDAIIR